jgi:hypothetical protein
VAARLTRPALLVLLGLASVWLAGCGGGSGPAATVLPASVGPGASVSAAVAQTRGELARTLGAAGYQVTDPQVPYRPAEAPRFAAAPRAVVQVLLAEDLDAGYLSIYEFGSVPAAADAGREQAAYLGSGPGRVQFPSDARFVIRQVGTTVIFYAWSPGATEDPRAAGIVPVLEAIGSGIDVPS